MMEIKKATRTGIKPLIVMYSESGCGKTYSSLALARGMAGPDGRMIIGDSESGRASLYADIPIFKCRNGDPYETVEISEPFAPQKYIDLIDLIEDSGAAVGIIDSGSHEWEGVGGVIDLAADNEARSGKGLHTWKAPKYEHAKFVQRLMRSKIPWIVCLRAKYKTRQSKDQNGKTVIVKDDVTSPIQAEDFIFEATCHFELLPNHSIILTKHSHPGLKACFPADKTTPIEIKHGEMISKWCAAGGAPHHDRPIVSKEIVAIKNKLWKLTDKIHLGRASALEQYLWDENILDPTKSLGDLSEIELRAVYAATEKKIREGEGVTP